MGADPLSNTAADGRKEINVEITIGVRNVARELNLEITTDGDAVVEAVSAALAKAAEGEEGAILDISDGKGRRIVVPIEALGFVEIGADEPRRVGFGTI